MYLVSGFALNYIYNNKLKTLPQAFESREASCYLAAIELLSKYKCAGSSYDLFWIS